MRKYLIILSIVCIMVLGGFLYQNYSPQQKISPYLTYAHLTPGTYRLGYVDLNNEYTIDNLKIKGTIPEWLSGTLLRNGPAKFTIGNSWVTNWLDGLAMIHSFTFDYGKVSYANKFIVTDDYKIVQKTGKMSFAGFAQDPCKSIFKKLFTHFIPEFQERIRAPNVNVNISYLANKYVALTEVPLPVQFDPQTLETLGVVHFNDQFPESNIHTSVHPHYDPITKEQFGFFTIFGRKSSHNVYSINDGKTERDLIASIPVEEPSYMHSFAITPHYIILSLLPYVVNPLDLLISNKPFIKNFKWKPELGTKLAVIDRIKKEIVGIFKTEPFFAFHNVNAYEKENTIVMDIVTYDTPLIIDELNLSNLLAPKRVLNEIPTELYSSPVANPRLKRAVINLTTSKVLIDQISKEMGELPRINYAFNGKEYQYAYMSASNDPSYFTSIIKMNVNTGELLKWSQELCYPGEPVFVPYPYGKEEDEGVILSVVLDAVHENSFMLILDAKNLKEIGRATVPHHIPFGLHGIYIPK